MHEGSVIPNPISSVATEVFWSRSGPWQGSHELLRLGLHLLDGVQKQTGRFRAAHLKLGLKVIVYK